MCVEFVKFIIVICLLFIRVLFIIVVLLCEVVIMLKIFVGKLVLLKSFVSIRLLDRGLFFEGFRMVVLLSVSV